MIRKRFAATGLSFVASDGAPDRMNDRVFLAGWEIAGFQKNPVFLWSHNATIPPIGRVNNLRIESGALRGDAVLDESDPFAVELKRKIDAGFVTGISVGFKPIAAKANPLGGIDFLKSELLEISLVSVPANPNALITRDLMNTIESLKSRRADLFDVVEKSLDSDDFDALQKQIADIDLQITRAESVRAMKAQNAVPVHVHPLDQPPGQADEIYSLARLLRSVANHESCPELNYSHRLAAQHGAAKGVYLPFSIEKASLTGSLANAGALVSDYTGALIQRLIEPSLLNRLPISRMTMPKGSGELVMPRLGSGTSAAWLSETGTATESNPTFGKITLSPRRLAVYARFSRMLLASSSPSIDNVLVGDMSIALSEALDSAMLNGSGNQEPMGILGQATALVEGSYSNLYDALVGCVSTLEAANVTGPGIAWLASPAAMTRLRTSFIADSASATDGVPILAPGAGLLGFPVIPTNNLSGSLLVLARWSDVVAATWSPGLDTIVDPFSQAEQGLIRLVSELYVDFGVRHQASLVKLTLAS